jgi:pimeloyl-ACP methyl ester carboxylesterase
MLYKMAIDMIASTTREGLRFEIRDRDGPEVILLLPGLFAGGWMWDSSLPCLMESRWTVIRLLDSLSEMPISPPLLDAAVEAVGKLVLSLSNRQVVIVANSLGGIVAIELGRRISNVTGVLLSGCPGLSGSIRLGIPVTRDVDFEGALHIAKQIYYDSSRIDGADVSKLLSVLTSRTSVKRMLRWLTSTRDYPLLERLMQLNRDLFLIWGEEDGITPVGPWKLLAGKTPRCRLAVISSCGHSPMMEKPGEFNREFSALISSHFDEMADRACLAK